MREVITKGNTVTEVSPPLDLAKRFRVGDLFTIKGCRFRMELVQRDRMVLRCLGLERSATSRRDRRASKREALKSMLRQASKSRQVVTGGDHG
jgi:hypothetical protein